MGLLCSRNAHARKVLVGRAQWEANRPPFREEKASKLGRIIWMGEGRSIRAGTAVPERHRWVS